MRNTNRLFAQLEQLPKTAIKARAAAKKDFLWKELIMNPRITGALGIIEEKDIRILEAARMICDRGIKPRLPVDELKLAENIAAKIREFHAEGKCIKEIKQLTEIMSKEKGKLPLFETGKNDFHVFLHEAIHYILHRNEIETNNNSFNEGLCTYLHTRAYGKLVRISMYFFGGRKDYLRWAEFFSAKFAKIPDFKIGLLLKRNLQSYAHDFKTFI